MNKLISMIDYVGEVQKYLEESNNYKRGCELMIAHAELLSLPIRVEMFVPCDDDGNVLKSPDCIPKSFPDYNIILPEYKKLYEEAKNRVLFEVYENYGVTFIRNLDKELTIFFQKETFYGMAET